MGMMIAQETLLFVLLIVTALNPEAWSLRGNRPQCVAVIMIQPWLLTPWLKPSSSAVSTAQLRGSMGPSNTLSAVFEENNGVVI